MKPPLTAWRQCPVWFLSRQQTPGISMERWSLVDSHRIRSWPPRNLLGPWRPHPLGQWLQFSCSCRWRRVTGSKKNMLARPMCLCTEGVKVCVSCQPRRLLNLLADGSPGIPVEDYLGYHNSCGNIHLLWVMPFPADTWTIEVEKGISVSIHLSLSPDWMPCDQGPLDRGV